MTLYKMPLTPNSQSECPKRHEERHAFLGQPASTLIALPTDASKRRYFRHEGGLLMDAPLSENPDQFVRIARYLESLGLSAPCIYKEDLSSGFIHLEDFGDATYTRLLEAGEDPYPLYDLAVDTLIALHQNTTHQPDFIPIYGKEKMLVEVESCLDWYVRYALEINVSAEQRQNYLDLWSEVLELALNIPHTLVLRDYHVDNLMRLTDRPGIKACGLLDFQDAGWGPIVYDLMSLVEDERFDVELALVDHCWQRYLAAFPQVGEDDLRRAGAILGASRHAKNLTVFTRLAVRDGKTSYLKYIPRTEQLLRDCLENPHLHGLKAWFEEHGHAQEALPKASKKRAR